MGRKPYPTAKARRLLETWATTVSGREDAAAQLTNEKAIEFLSTQRGLALAPATFYKQKLHEVIAPRRAALAASPQATRRDEELAAYEAQVEQLRAEAATLKQQVRLLQGLVATMHFNAREAGISAEQLERPMPVVAR